MAMGTLQLDDRAPAFNLPSVDGRTYSLETFSDKPVLVVIFSCNHCPYVHAYEDRMVERAKAKGFNFPYLRDAKQAVAQSYGATHTPHLFVFDRERRLCYTGKIDDNWQDPSAVSRHYLREALDALLQGSAPTDAKTHAIGCTIKWVR